MFRLFDKTVVKEMRRVEPDITIIANGEHRYIDTTYRRGSGPSFDEYAYRFDGLGDCENENALLSLFSPWLLDIEQLRARRQSPYHQPLPRITLSASLTNKGNFRLEWEPTYYENGKCDFVHHPTYGGPSFSDRPENELLFLRGVGEAMMHLRIDRREKPKGPIRGNIDGAFLYALYEHVADLVRRLSVLFDITWLQRFNITEELGEDGKRHLLMAYLESRQEQEVREAQLRIEAISNELDSIFTSLGLTPDDYDMLHASVSTDTKGGDEISNMGFNRRLTQVLKTRSRKANSRTVMTIERLLKESEDLRDRYNVDV